jgi:hypothetical protein
VNEIQNFAVRNPGIIAAFCVIAAAITGFNIYKIGVATGLLTGAAFDNSARAASEAMGG